MPDKVRTTIGKYKYNDSDVCLNPDTICHVQNRNCAFEIRVAMNGVGWGYGYSYLCGTSGGGQGVWLQKKPYSRTYETKDDAIKACINELLPHYKKVPAVIKKLNELIPGATVESNCTDPTDKIDCTGHTKKKCRNVQTKPTVPARSKKSNQDRTDKNNYTGSKGADGMCEFLINHIPVHKMYFELFAGSAQLFQKKLPAALSILTELDEIQCDKLRFLHIAASYDVINTNAIDYLRNYKFDSSIDFIYLDPPYPASARKSTRPLYKYEMMDDASHIELLEVIKKIPANIMISCRQNQLYDQVLKDWHKKKFLTGDRGGAVHEIIYMNYDISKLFLHQYDYVGNGCHDRQRIKRKVGTFTNKLKRLDNNERHLFIQTILKQYPAEVQHFSTI